jgi:hypothetical protein
MPLSGVKFRSAEITQLYSAASPNQVFYNTKVDGEDNGPQRDGALLGNLNPVAHPSGAEGGAACAVRGVLVRVLGGRRGRWRLGAACFAARCTVHGAGGGDGHGVIKINAYAYIKNFTFISVHTSLVTRMYKRFFCKTHNSKM